jgi:threonine dehydrogenase-like Zn-dependent dehydrogenase
VTDDQLRSLIRDVVAKRLADRGDGPSDRSDAPDTARPHPPAGHPSHALYVTLVNAGDACLIEPSVRCTHCGYCKSHGF